MSKALTKRQKDVFDFLVEVFRQNDQLPPAQCIADKFKFASTNSATCHLNTLENRGLIEKNKFGKYRFTRNASGHINIDSANAMAKGACKVDEILCGVRLVGGESVFAILNREYAERYVPHFNARKYPKRLEIVDWPGTEKEHAESWKLHAKSVCATIGAKDIWSNR